MAESEAPPPAAKDSDRRHRLAQALRENLRRRKAAARSAPERAPAGEAGDGDGGD